MKTKLYKFKHLNPITLLETRSRLGDGLNRKVSLGWVNLNTKDSSGFI